MNCSGQLPCNCAETMNLAADLFRPIAWGTGPDPQLAHLGEPVASATAPGIRSDQVQFCFGATWRVGSLDKPKE